MPVWSSNLIVGFTKDKRVGFMQFHWPEIPKQVTNEANRLAFKLKRGWKPPVQEGAKVEAVEAWHHPFSCTWISNGYFSGN